MIYTLSSVKTLDGRMAGGHFTNRILFISSLEPGAQTLYEFTELYKNLEAPLLDSRLEIYTVTISPTTIPGTRKKTRNDHIVRYFQNPGTHALAAGVDPALLTTGAQFFKYATKGTPGEIFMRGVLSELELRSTDGGDPNNSDLPLNDAINNRFRTYAANLPGLFSSLAGGRLVMPGVSRNADGSIPTLAQYEATCRIVAKVEFDGFAQRQIHKQTRSIDSKSLDLMRSMGAQLLTSYNDALQDANNVVGAIPSGTTADLREKGRLIYNKFTAAERQKLRIPPYVKAYIAP
jgi:hypothetical protein